MDMEIFKLVALFCLLCFLASVPALLVYLILFIRTSMIKEIKSKEGVIHFRRYRILWTPWFAIYLHNIRQPDKDIHLHDHPWNLLICILKGGYWEIVDKFKPKDGYTPTDDFEYHEELKDGYITRSIKNKPGQIFYRKSTDFHQIGKLLTPSVWTLCLTFGKRRQWGYQTEDGWIDHETYRRLKHEGTWD